MSDELSELEQQTRRKFSKALAHLASSVRKTAPLVGRPLDGLSENELVELEGLAGRFGRAADLATRRLMRLLILKDDPDFDGTVRDLFNRCEKLGYIDSTPRWMKMREDRNKVVHEYEEIELEKLYARLLEYSMDLNNFAGRI